MDINMCFETTDKIYDYLRSIFYEFFWDIIRMHFGYVPNFNIFYEYLCTIKNKKYVLIFTTFYFFSFQICMLS